MAAGSISNDFDMGLGFRSKRKRRYDDDDSTNIHDLFVAKRRNLTQLPIRSPPRPSIAVTPAFGHFGIHPGTLTPDSIPEDDETHDQQQQQQQYNARPHSNSNTSSNGSLRVNVPSNGETTTDIEMDIGSPKQRPPPTPIRIGRARSNDLLSPVRSPTAPPSLSFLNNSPKSHTFARDRVPTPTTSTFPSRSPFESTFTSAAARQMRPHLLTTSLSPMVDAESWTPQIQRPPSPSPELDAPFDEDAMMMGVEESHMMSSSFSSLSVHSRDPQAQITDLNSSPTRGWSSQTSPSPRARGLGLDGTSSVRPDDMRMSTIGDSQRVGGGVQHSRNQSTGRTARLHMGFRADCEKCVARVPGHYSHILWT